MADLNDLNKPDTTSNYSTEVLQTLRAHVARLWTGDYTGMGNLVTGMRRWVNLGSGNVKLVQRDATGVEATLFDSALKASAGANSDITSLGGLTTALSVAQGGTGAKTAATARAALGAAQSGANADIISTGNNTSTIYTTGGTSTAYTITPSPAITSYAIGQSFVINFSAASGASPTLQINSIASPPQLVKSLPNGTYANIAANDFSAGHRSRVTLISTTQALVERLAPQTIAAGAAPVFAPRAWCKFNGSTTGTNAPLAGGNVTSVTRNSAGNYTINFTTAMADANYCVAATAEFTSGSSNAHIVCTPSAGFAAGSLVVTTVNLASTAEDATVVSVAIFR